VRSALAGAAIGDGAAARDRWNGERV
jgi:hypothetical protein